jgi:protein-tyrosine phosphatase
MGKEAKRLAERMIANRWVHFLATDAHDTKRRPPKMREAHDIVGRKYGSNYADLICSDNPRDVFDGHPLGEQEEGLDLFDPNPFKEHWWQRLLRL